MANVKLAGSLYLLVCILILLRAKAIMGSQGSKTILKGAVAEGAVCLDGSPPAYYFDKGFGDGINNWIVYLEAGGWCHTSLICSMRSRNLAGVGSSLNFPETIDFNWILSNDPKENPGLYNWNRVFVKYCDGGSFSGDLIRKEDTKSLQEFLRKIGIPYWNQNNGTLHFKGARIFDAVVKDLSAKGMSNAKNAVLAGASAGGLGAILNCDRFRSKLPDSTKVKCLADSGFFMDVPGIDNKPIWRGHYEFPGNFEVFFGDVATLHGSTNILPRSCTLKMNPNLCFFPANMVSAIRTPLFILNSAIDSWQVDNILNIQVSPMCGGGVNCPAWQLKPMQDLRTKLINEVTKLGSSSSNNGWYIHSCFTHVESLTSLWITPLVNNQTIAQAFSDWVFDRRVIREIDFQRDVPKYCPAWV